MIFMLTRQAMLIKTLVEVLKSRGVVENDDFSAFDELVRREEVASGDVAEGVAKQYQAFAKALSVETGIVGP
jgi:hypothetical protein